MATDDRDRNSVLRHGTACADGLETRFRQGGCGAPVLLLARPDAFWVRRLVPQLLDGHRVIVPERDAGADDDDTRRWLAGFLDALVGGRAAFVGDRPWFAALLGLALLEPERVTRLVFALDHAGPAAARPPREEQLHRSGLPLLFLWQDPSHASTTGPLLRFLQTGIATPP